jgi:hypothetical protein
MPGGYIGQIARLRFHLELIDNGMWLTTASCFLIAKNSIMISVRVCASSVQSPDESSSMHLCRYCRKDSYFSIGVRVKNAVALVAYQNRMGVAETALLQFPVERIDILKNYELARFQMLALQNGAYSAREVPRGEMRFAEYDDQGLAGVCLKKPRNTSCNAEVPAADAAHVITGVTVDTIDRNAEIAGSFKIAL